MRTAPLVFLPEPSSSPARCIPERPLLRRPDQTTDRTGVQDGAQGEYRQADGPFQEDQVRADARCGDPGPERPDDEGGQDGEDPGGALAEARCVEVGAS